MVWVRRWPWTSISPTPGSDPCPGRASDDRGSARFSGAGRRRLPLSEAPLPLISPGGPAGDPPAHGPREAAVGDDGGVLPGAAGDLDQDGLRPGDHREPRVVVRRLHPAWPVVDAPHPALPHAMERQAGVLGEGALDVGA